MDLYLKDQIVTEVKLTSEVNVDPLESFLSTDAIVFK